MIKKLKVMGLALVAVMALGALSASGALAAEAHFTAETGTTQIKGSGGSHVFKTTGIPITCTGEFTGTVTELTTTQQTVTAKYTSCEFLGASVTVDMKSCHYLFKAGTYGPTAGTSVGTADVVCTTAGDEITFSAPGCTVRVPAQTGLAKVHYETVTEGTKEVIKVKPEISGIKDTHEGFTCGTGTSTTGTYTAPAVTMKGSTSKGAQTSVTITST